MRNFQETKKCGACQTRSDGMFNNCEEVWAKQKQKKKEQKRRRRDRRDAKAAGKRNNFTDKDYQGLYGTNTTG